MNQTCGIPLAPLKKLKRKGFEHQGGPTIHGRGQESKNARGAPLYHSALNCLKSFHAHLKSKTRHKTLIIINKINRGLLELKSPK